MAARTCVAENLPENPTAESVTRLFSAAGPVRMVRVCPPTAAAQSAKSTLQAAAQQAAELDPAGALAGALAVVSTQVHALVEFETEARSGGALHSVSAGTASALFTLRCLVFSAPVPRAPTVRTPPPRRPTQAAAHNAVRALNDAQNWRSGLRVRLVYKGSVHKTQQARVAAAPPHHPAAAGRALARACGLWRREPSG